ncbi:helix-turn-helix domain-containing protein [Paenibacillus farraposensis]|uniref:helix-turn-helix domain-containing protein n=1 Tax=Paenibacillus farraposensis TaxID=2807095 RepID=UPI0036199295
MHLKRYCYGDIDYCWPDLDLIGAKMKKSRNTIKKYLAILEKYGFVLMFNVMNADKNNMEESPLFKIRRQVPFLPRSCMRSFLWISKLIMISLCND